MGWREYPYNLIFKNAAGQDARSFVLFYDANLGNGDENGAGIHVFYPAAAPYNASGHTFQHYKLEGVSYSKDVKSWPISTTVSSPLFYHQFKPFSGISRTWHSSVATADKDPNINFDKLKKW